MAPSSEFRVVILKWDRLYGDLIRHYVLQVWSNASVLVFQRGFEALESIQARVPDLFITGVRIDDMDGLEHLEPFVDSTLPILIVTSGANGRALSLLQELRYDGIYDGAYEGLAHLPRAPRAVVEHRLYVSPSVLPQLKRPKRLTLDALTNTEQVVLSIIGDGSDDHEAGDRLSMSHHTVNSHRKAIMRKLKLHHKGQLMRYAVQHGYVIMLPQVIYYPGAQRRLAMSR